VLGGIAPGSAGYTWLAQPEYLVALALVVAAGLLVAMALRKRNSHRSGSYLDK